MLLLAPSQAFAVQYSRVITVANQAAAFSNWKTSALAPLGNAIVNAGPGTSVMARAVAAAGGWPVLGVMAGLTIWSVYYNNTQVADIKAAIAEPDTFTVDGNSYPSGSVYHPDCTSGQCPSTAPFGISMPTSVCTGPPPYPTVPANWQGFFLLAGACWLFGNNSGSPSPAVITPGEPGTATDATNYLSSLDPGDPLSPNSNMVPQGQNHDTQTADNTVNVPLDSTSATTTVVPTSSVDPDDIVVNNNAAPPAGAQDPVSGDTSTTDTTTTTVDGDTTTNQTDSEANVQCNVGEHDQRSYGSIMKEAIDSWQESGLLSQLNVLKNLTWPTTVPVLELNSTLMGTFNLDFTQWSGTLTALRTLVIAIASFAAYRIIFAGGSAG